MEKIIWKKKRIVGLSTHTLIVRSHKVITVRYKGRLLYVPPIGNTLDLQFKLVKFNPKDYGEDMDYRIDLVADKLAKVGLTVLDRSDFLNPACRFGGKQLVSFVKS